jgi:hypothetical protein
MSLTKPFGGLEVCRHGKSLNSLATGKVSCEVCEAEASEKIQTLPLHQHFINAFFHLLSFEFSLAFGGVLVGIGMTILKVSRCLKHLKKVD